MINKPEWIRGKVSWDESFNSVKELANSLKLNSVCVSAACPNKGECWQKKHITFMILGDVCTRDCKFCNISSGKPKEVDLTEPERIAEAVKKLDAKYVVITSVTRDDLSDQGAEQFVSTVKEIKKIKSDTMVELLIPDFGGERQLLDRIISSGCEVIGHNLEMPKSLYREARPKADYSRSIKTLKVLSGNSIAPIKSSIMVGLGETKEDIFKTLKDLKSSGVSIVYIGQYLSPTKSHFKVKKYYNPEEFSFLERTAKDMGFKAVCVGPMVRSSYRAFESFKECLS
jgi:lipoic acid synthetase